MTSDAEATALMTTIAVNLMPSRKSSNASMASNPFDQRTPSSNRMQYTNTRRTPGLRPDVPMSADRLSAREGPDQDLDPAVLRLAFGGRI